MHRPSLPEDLLPLDRLWARAVLLHLCDPGTGFEGNEVSCPDGGGGSWWWTLGRLPGGRGFFWGQDADGSHGHLRDDPVDFLAGGPEWLPWDELRYEAEGMTIGYLYWWQDGSWARAPYPDDMEDDGLDMSVPWAGGDTAALLSRVPVNGPESEGAVLALLDRLERGTADEAAVRALAEALRGEEDPDPGPGRALASLRAAGLL
ncbi:hypothetical protein SUDANB121_03471 [Nocardiopsis dassonvillei]|uniref:hypothetical protein n=1 Tax=Nocardiopsis dassonvillei TaxID=2014 RepID=UPI003F54A04B